MLEMPQFPVSRHLECFQFAWILSEFPMGRERKKFILAVLAILFMGATDSLTLAQISGIDHYRSRLGHSQQQRPPQRRQPQPSRPAAQTQTQPRRPAAQTQTQPPRSRVSQTAHQLPLQTKPVAIDHKSDSRFARRSDVFSFPTSRTNRLKNILGSDEQRPSLPYQNSSSTVPSFPVSAKGNTALGAIAPFSRQIDDVFGEEQVPGRVPTPPEVPSRPSEQVPDRVPNPRRRLPFNFGNDTELDPGGVVVPPGKLKNFDEPDFLDDQELTPGVKPDQKVPRPGQRDDQNNVAPKRDAFDESFEPEEFDPSMFDPADPRHPNANNGPESWYRPGNRQPVGPATRNVPPYQYGQYGSNAAPLPTHDAFGKPIQYAHPYPQHYAQPNYQQPVAQNAYPAGGYADPTTNVGSAYSDVCQTGCSQYSAQGGCNSCGTGLVNGCMDSMFYLSLFGGYTDMSSVTVNDGTGDFRFEMDDGFGAGGAIGQFQGRNLRTEVEFSYRENDLESLTMPGNPAFVAPALENAQLRSYTGMVNVIWEFVSVPCDRVKPYVGAGFGFVNVQAEAALAGMDALADIDDSDSSFGYQAIGGLNFRASEMLDIFVEYKYLKADSLQLGNFGFDYETHNLFGGARIKF